MFKFQKAGAILLSLLMLAGAMTACGGGSGSTSVEETQSVNQGEASTPEQGNKAEGENEVETKTEIKNDNLPKSSIGLAYIINDDGKTCTVTGIGTCMDTDIVIGQIDGYPVTSIGFRAFLRCTSLTNITIGNSVTSIGDGAFRECTSLANITIGNSVTSIGVGAFLECTSLASITIPNSVTSIGSVAFEKCSSLISVYITDIANWCEINFDGALSNPLECAHNLYLNNELVTDLVIPDSVTMIRHDAFNDCSSLTSVTIPDGVTSIGDSAFSGCSSLTSITIPNSVKYIGSSAFSGCSSLTSITIPHGVTEICKWTFDMCSSLTSVTIPNSVTKFEADVLLGEGEFNRCYSLTDIYFTGTFDEWRAIKNKPALHSGITIHYNYIPE